MKRSVTLVQAGLGPQYWSLRTSSTRSSRAKLTNLKGPEPTMPLPLEKSSLVRPSVAFLLTMKIDVRSDSISGYGVAVMRRIVLGSTSSFFTTDLV